MKTIGIGITTYNRPSISGFTIAQVSRYCHPADCIYVHDDKEHRGVAYSKNECLKQLQGCDYIFLLDDDCFPIKDGWTDFFINAHLISGQHCFNYIRPTASFRMVKEYNFSNGTIIEVFNSSGGAMLFLTQEVIKQVGGFCKDYGMYGFEHLGYTYRIYKAGLNPLGAHLNILLTGQYLYALDFDFHLPYNKQLNFDKYQMINMDAKLKSLHSNREIFLREKEIIFQEL